MYSSKDIMPCDYVAEHIHELIKDVYDNQRTIVITQDGYAKAVILSIKEYEETLRTFEELKSSIQLNIKPVENV